MGMLLGVNVEESIVGFKPVSFKISRDILGSRWDIIVGGNGRQLCDII